MESIKKTLDKRVERYSNRERRKEKRRINKTAKRIWKVVRRCFVFARTENFLKGSEVEIFQYPGGKIDYQLKGTQRASFRFEIEDLEKTMREVGIIAQKSEIRMGPIIREGAKAAWGFYYSPPKE